MLLKITSPMNWCGWSLTMPTRTVVAKQETTTAKLIVSEWKKNIYSVLSVVLCFECSYNNF